MFVRHQPFYQSEQLIKFLNKLDNRSEKQTCHQPRTKREIRSPLVKDIPPHAKNWMIKPQLRSKEDSENEIEKIDKLEDHDDGGNDSNSSEIVD